MTGLDVKLGAGGKAVSKIGSWLGNWMDGWRCHSWRVRTGEQPGFWGREFMSLDLDMLSCDDTDAPYMMQSCRPWGSCSANTGLGSPEGSRGERPVLLSRGSHWGSTDLHGWRSFWAQKLMGVQEGGRGWLCRGHLWAESKKMCRFTDRHR